MAYTESMLTGSSVFVAEESAHSICDQVSTGCQSIDDALQGGFEYGKIATVAAPEASLRSALSYHLIVSHLVRKVDSQAIVIDTTGSFSVHDLWDVAVDKFQQTSGNKPLLHQGYIYEMKNSRDSISEAEALALRLLERVQINRVFDFKGIVDIIGSLSSLSRCREAARSHAPNSLRDCCLNASIRTDGIGKEQTQATGADLMIIDDIAGVLQPIITRNNIEAQALLTSLHRNLLHLVRFHGSCTIIFNNIIGADSIAQVDPKKQQISGELDAAASIFPLAMVRAAVGKTFSHLVDLAILIHKLPISKPDAENVHAGSKSRITAGEHIAETIEVIKDKSGRRLDRFGVFRVNGCRIENIGP